MTFYDSTNDEHIDAVIWLRHCARVFGEAWVSADSQRQDAACDHLCAAALRFADAVRRVQSKSTQTKDWELEMMDNPHLGDAEDGSQDGDRVLFYAQRSYAKGEIMKLEIGLDGRMTEVIDADRGEEDGS